MITHRMPEAESGAWHPVPAGAPWPARTPRAGQRLSPTERAAFVLRHLFACDLPRIATALGCSEEVCRRLAGTAVAADGHAAPGGGPWCIAGAENVARLLAAAVPARVRIGAVAQQQEVAGRPGVIFRDRTGEILGALAFDIVDGRIRTLRVLPGSERIQ